MKISPNPSYGHCIVLIIFFLRCLRELASLSLSRNCLKNSSSARPTVRALSMLQDIFVWYGAIDGIVTPRVGRACFRRQIAGFCFVRNGRLKFGLIVPRVRLYLFSRGPSFESGANLAARCSPSEIMIETANLTTHSFRQINILKLHLAFPEGSA